jgi:hypothetical protein
MNNEYFFDKTIIPEYSLFPEHTNFSLEEENEEEDNFLPYNDNPIYQRFREIDVEAKQQLYQLFSLQLQKSGLKKSFSNGAYEIVEQISCLRPLPREIKKLHETTLLMSTNLLIVRIKEISSLLTDMNKKLEDFIKSLYSSMPSISMFPQELEKIRKKYSKTEKEWIVPISKIKKDLSLKLTERSKWDIKSTLKSNELSIVLSCFDCLQDVFQENWEQSIKQTTAIKEIKAKLDNAEKEMNESKNTFLYSFEQINSQIKNSFLGTPFESYINPATITYAYFVIARTFGYGEVIKPYPENSDISSEVLCNESKNHFIDDLKEGFLSERIVVNELVQSLSQEEKSLMQKFLVLVDDPIIPNNRDHIYCIPKKELLKANPIMIDLMRLLPPLPIEIKGLWNIALQTILIQFIALTEVNSGQSDENEGLLKLLAKHKNEDEKIQELKSIIPLLPYCPLNIQELIKTVFIYQQIQTLEKETEITIVNSSTIDSTDKKNYCLIKSSYKVDLEKNAEQIYEFESEETSLLQEELRIILYHKNLRKLFPREITQWEQAVANKLRIPPEYLFSFLPEILNLHQSLPLLSETKIGSDHQLETKISELVIQIQEGEKQFAVLDTGIQKEISYFKKLDEEFFQNFALLQTLEKTFQAELSAINKMIVSEKGGPEKSDFKNLHQTFIDNLSKIVPNDSYQNLHEKFLNDFEPNDKIINELEFKSDYQTSHTAFMKELQEMLKATYLKHIQQIQLKIANYRKIYQTISNEIIHPMIKSHSDLEILLKKRIQLDQTSYISKNCLDIITTHFDITLEDLNSTLNVYQVFTNKCKEAKITLSTEFKKMNQSVHNFKLSLNKIIYFTKYKPTDPTSVRSETIFLSFYPIRFNNLNSSLNKSPLEIQEVEQI